VSDSLVVNARRPDLLPDSSKGERSTERCWDNRQALVTPEGTLFFGASLRERMGATHMHDEIKLIDALTGGHIDRREFLARAAALGLSAPFIAAILGTRTPCGVRGYDQRMTARLA